MVYKSLSSLHTKRTKSYQEYLASLFNFFQQKILLLGSHKFDPTKTVINSGRKPTAVKGFKYGSTGLHSRENLDYLNLPENMRTAIANLLNHSLSAGTWSSYKTVGNLLQKCQEDTKTIMTFPMDTRRVILFIHWLFETRKITSSTANTYLSGLRYLHIAEGVELPILRPPIVEQILKGKKNLENIKNRQEAKPKRAPITLNTMLLLKIEIKNWESNREDKALVWTVCTMAFNGCLRIHEILCKEQDRFDPDFTLLGSDIKLKASKYQGKPIKSIQLRLKSPKEDRIGKGKIIDIYQNDGPICPVKALERWMRLRSQTDINLPPFRWKNGSCLTGRKLNKLLKQFLSKHLDYNQGKFSSHSFRAGMATLMGTLGFSDEDIMAMGRWSSQAFLDYLKLPRTRRIEIAKKIGNAVQPS